MKKMNWHSIAERIDAMSLRERALIFASAVVAVIVLMNALLLDPLTTQQKKLSQEIAQYQRQLDGTQGQYQLMMEASLKDPDAASKIKLAALRQQIVQSDAQLSRVQRSLVPPEKMASLLEDILVRNRHLQLAALNTLPVSAVGETPSTGGAASLFYRHGVEITVKGNYLALMHYLTQLEKLTPQMLWGKASLRVLAYPESALTLTFYTLSTDKSWLKV